MCTLFDTPELKLMHLAGLEAHYARNKFVCLCIIYLHSKDMSSALPKAPHASVSPVELEFPITLSERTKDFPESGLRNVRVFRRRTLYFGRGGRAEKRKFSEGA